MHNSKHLFPQCDPNRLFDGLYDVRKLGITFLGHSEQPSQVIVPTADLARNTSRGTRKQYRVSRRRFERTSHPISKRLRPEISTYSDSSEVTLVEGLPNMPSELVESSCTAIFYMRSFEKNT